MVEIGGGWLRMVEDSSGWLKVIDEIEKLAMKTIYGGWKRGKVVQGG